MANSDNLEICAIEARQKGEGKNVKAMNLYFVTCVKQGVISNELLGVFVVADNPCDAEEKALSLMRKLQYKYTDRVDKIELLASINTYRAGALLVI